MEDDVQQLQEDELTALRSILIEGVQDLRPTGQKKWTPLELLINVEPQESFAPERKTYATLALYIKCSPSYPKSCLDALELRNPKGVPSAVLSTLEDELRELCKRHQGCEVIYTLVDHIRQFLSPYNRPGYASIYDEMLGNKEREIAKQNERQELSLEIKRQKEEEERRLLKQELERKEEVLKIEARVRRDSTHPIPDQDDSSGYPSSPSIMSRKRFSNPLPECSSVHESYDIKVYDVSAKSDYQIQKRSCRLHNDLRGCNEYDVICFKDNDYMGPAVITEWIVRWKTIGTEGVEKLDDLVGVKNELQQVAPKINHMNLICPSGFGIGKERDFFSIVVCHPKVDGIRLNQLPYVMMGATLGHQQLVNYSKQILNALSYLHRNGLNHGDLKDTNIFIKNNGRLCITGSVVESLVVRVLSDVMALETKVQNVIKDEKKLDVFRFGLIFIFMYDWKWSFEYLLQSRKLPSINAPHPIGDFIDCCTLHVSPAEELLKHSFFKNEWRDSISSIQSEFESDLKDAIHPPIPVPAGKTRHSRLVEEFDVIEKIGKGGFGEVFKAKHKLDQKFYALKRIPLNVSQKLQNKIFREVNLLSGLEHENIVRYFSTWIETTSEESDDSTSEDTTDTCKRVVTTFASSQDSGEDSASSSGEDVTGIFEPSQKGPNDTVSSDIVVFEEVSHNNNEESTPAIKGQKGVSVQNTMVRFLYVQMELVSI